MVGACLWTFQRLQDCPLDVVEALAGEVSELGSQAVAFAAPHRPRDAGSRGQWQLHPAIEGSHDSGPRFNPSSLTAYNL